MIDRQTLLKQFPRALSCITHSVVYHAKDVWLFPFLIFIVFIVFVAFGINGSSEGTYSSMLTGNVNDTNLLAGKPRPIRSDEWIVITQMVLAQKEASYPSVNDNIGNGQNMNLVLDVPSRDWSQLFRPQNSAFVILPFVNAFAFRWWFSAVVMLVSVYFFVLFFIPKRRILASAIAVSIYFSAFIQWWYISSTLASIGYCVLLALLYVYLINTESFKRRVLIASLMAYTMLCFMIILYPPFQIPCVIATLLFAAGYTLYVYRTREQLSLFLKQYGGLLALVLAITAMVTGLYFYQNRAAVNIIQNTAYPGKRIVESGGYNISHLLSGQLAYQHLSSARSSLYKPEPNQSESSTFIFVSLFLIAPYIYLVLKSKEAEINKSLPVFIAIGCGFALFLAWLFVPGLSFIGTITKLDMVPQNRLIIGLGLLNFFALVAFLHLYSRMKYRISTRSSLLFATITFLAVYVINKSIQFNSPGFVGNLRVIAFALPIALIVFLILRKRFEIGLILLALFSVAGAGSVNPLYIGLGPVTNNALFNKIASYPNDGTRWIVEDIQFENFALMAGKKSLSGVFFYPQKELWKSIDNGASELKYNRYAHVSYNLDTNPNSQITTGFADTGADQLVIKTELCSDFIKSSNIRHVVSSAKIEHKDQVCIENIDPVGIAGQNKTFYIYTLKF